MWAKAVFAIRMAIREISIYSMVALAPLVLGSAFMGYRFPETLLLIAPLALVLALSFLPLGRKR